MPNPATPVTLSKANDALTIQNLGGSFLNDVQRVFELSGTFTSGTIIVENQRSSGAAWTKAAYVDLSAPTSSLSGNTSLTDSTNYSFNAMYAAGFYATRIRLISDLGSGTITADGAGLGSTETMEIPITIGVNTTAIAQTITSASANALAVGANGATNPVLQVDASTGSVATGLKMKGAAAASGMALQVITTGTNEDLLIDAAAAGTVKVGTVAATALGLQVGSSTSAANAKLIVQTTSATGFCVGRLGATTPALIVDASTATSITGLKIKSAAAGNGLALSAVGEASNGNLTVDAQGTGTITLQGTATGNVILGDAINLQFNTTTGTKIGSATTQKLAFWNATPIVQPANTVDYVTMLTNLGLRATGGTAAATFPGQVLSILAAAGGIGYGTGAGGAVTQASSRTTTVVLNTPTGAITLVSAAGSATPATFTVTNSVVAATDTVIVNQKSGTDVYETFVTNVAAGSFKITSFTTGGTTTEQPVFNFNVIKGVAS